MICPFCLQELEGNILDKDILCIHLKDRKCSFSQVQQDILNISNLYPTDMLEIVNACLKMKQLKYLYVRKQDVFLTARIRQYIYQQNKNFVQTQVVYNNIKGSNASAEQKHIQITIKPNQKLEEALLQIQFSENISVCQIIVQKRPTIPEQYEFTIDLNKLRQENNIFINDEEYNKYLVYDQIKNLQIDQDKKTFQFLFDYFQKIESHNQQQVIEQQKWINEDLRAVESFDQKQEQSYSRLIFTKMSQQLQNFSIKFPGIPIDKIKNLFISPINSSGSEEDYQKQKMKQDIKKIIIKVIFRRQQCIFQRFDMQDVFITMLQQLEYIDDVKITDEMRKQSINRCLNRYLYPHLAMLPKTIENIKNEEQSIFQRLFTSFFKINQYQTIQKRQSIVSSILLYKNQYYRNDLPILDITNSATLQDQAQDLLKVSLLNDKNNQKLICLTSNYQNSYITTSLTKNFPVYIDLDDKKNNLNYNQFTCIANMPDSDYIYVGTNKGQLFKFIKNIPFQDQLDQTSTVDDKYNTIPVFQIYNPIDECHEIQNIEYNKSDNNSIVQIQTTNDYITYVNQGGYLGIYDIINEQNEMFYLGYSSNICSTFNHQVLLGGEGVLQVFNVKQQKISNTVFQIIDQMDYSSFYTVNNSSDPGYYHLLTGKFINRDQLIVANAVSGLNLYDMRQSMTFPVCYIDLNTKLPVNNIDFNCYTMNQIGVAQYDGKFSIYDIRQTKLELAKFNSFSSSRSIYNKSQIKYMSSNKIVISLPFIYQLNILETQQMKIINEFKLDFLQDVCWSGSRQSAFKISDIEAISPYDLSFLMKSNTKSDVFTLSTM